MALAAAGCGNSGNSTSSAGAIAAQQNADDMAVQAVTGLAVVGGDVQNVFHDIAVEAPAGPARVAPARALWDTTVTAPGLTYQASAIFYDGSDQPLPGYGPQAVRLT